MKSILNRFQTDGFLHHAYLIVGPGELWPQFRPTAEAILGAAAVGHPDILVWQVGALGIDQSRALRAFAAAAPVRAARRLLVAEFRTATPEAQNALLRILEEPPARAHFFLLTVNVHLILPTLRSRCALVVLPPAAPPPAGPAARFLALIPEERLAFIKELLTEPPVSERAAALDFLDELETALAGRKRDETSPRAFQEVWSARRHLRDNAVLPRLLLEHVALIVPPDSLR